MKHTLLVFICLFTLNFTSTAQCDLQKHQHTEIKGYFLIKGYPLDSKSGTHNQIEHVAVLKEGQQYQLTTCTPNNTPSHVFIQILDHNRKLIHSNLKEEKLQTSLKFNIPKTGIYYFLFIFKNKKSHCAYGSLHAKEG